MRIEFGPKIRDCDMVQVRMDTGDFLVFAQKKVITGGIVGAWILSGCPFTRVRIYDSGQMCVQLHAICSFFFHTFFLFNENDDMYCMPCRHTRDPAEFREIPAPAAPLCYNTNGSYLQ